MVVKDLKMEIDSTRNNLDADVKDKPEEEREALKAMKESRKELEDERMRKIGGL